MYMNNVEISTDNWDRKLAMYVITVEINTKHEPENLSGLKLLYWVLSTTVLQFVVKCTE